MIYDEEGKLHYGTFNPKGYSNAYIHKRCITNIITYPKEIVCKLQRWYEGAVRERPHQMVDDWLQFVMFHGVC